MTPQDTMDCMPRQQEDPAKERRLDRGIGRRPVLRWAVGGGVALTGAALAQAVAPRGVAAQAEQQEEALVGSWQVTVNPTGQPGAFKAMVTFAADGSLVHSEDIATAAPPPLHTTTGHGAWIRMDENKFALRYVALVIRPPGAFGGTFTVRASPTVSDTADAFSGPFSAEVANPEGQLLLSLNGTVQATRIGVDYGQAGPLKPTRRRH